MFKTIKPFNFKKEAHHIPSYILLSLWVLFTVVVVGWIIAASLSTTKDIFSGEVLKFNNGLNFQNYVNAWETQNVGTIFKNSLIYASFSSVILILIAAPAAYALSRFKFVANMAIQKSFAGAMGVPISMLIIPLFSIVASLGLLDTNLEIRMLLIFLFVGINIPFTTIFLLSFFANLSKTFEEAAAVDGCSAIQTFWKVMLPLAQPGVIVVTIFNFINIWNEYFISLLFASGQEVRPVAIGLQSMIESMRFIGNWPGMFAAVIIVFMPTFILYIFLSDKIIEGVTGGAIKG